MAFQAQALRRPEEGGGAMIYRYVTDDPPEAVAGPDYFKPAARRLAPHDLILVTAGSPAAFGVLLVEAAGEGGVVTRPILPWSGAAPQPMQESAAVRADESVSAHGTAVEG